MPRRPLDRLAATAILDDAVVPVDVDLDASSWPIGCAMLQFPSVAPGGRTVREAGPDYWRRQLRRMQREGFDVARCTVAGLMKTMGLGGIIRGKPLRTTVGDKAAPRPLDHVNRQFHVPAPNMPWVSDFTDVATWTGFVSVAFVIDAYARRIVGWRASQTAHASLVLDGLEQALHDRRPAHRGGLVHHSDRGNQYISI